MGKMSELSIEIEYANLIVDTIYNYLKNGVSPKVKHQHTRILKILSDEIMTDYFRNLILNDLSLFYERINNSDNSDIEPEFILELLNTIDLIKYKIDLPEHFSNNSSVNSEKYYNNKINELTDKELELRQKLKTTENITDEQREITKNIELKLKLIENELEKKKKELELKQKQEDAKTDWEEKINDTFTQLKEYLNPIKKEHQRLNILYYTFASLSIITIILIILIEVNAVYKISDSEDLPTLSKYIMLFLPLPIAGALMWGFVYQMNRAQRQLILISNNIHSINYIQGLLISINNLSPNVNDSITRINNALDKIILNHLDSKYITNETELIREEKKDNFDIDKLLKLIKTIKNTTD
jgi:hypothetical protein